MAGMFTQERAIDIKQMQFGNYQIFTRGQWRSVDGRTIPGPYYGAYPYFATMPLSERPSEVTTSFRSGFGYDGPLTNSQIFENATSVARSSGPLPDYGHEFDSLKHKIVFTNGYEPIHLEYVYNGTPHKYDGKLMLFKDPYKSFGSSSTVLPFPTVPDVDITYGTKAIALSKPTNPNASVMTALLELRDGFPKLPGFSFHSGMRGRDVPDVFGNEYLNYVFGILPAISDVKKIIYAVRNSSKIVKQFARDSDKIVRRRFSFPEIRTTTTKTVSVDRRILDTAAGLANNSLVVNLGLSGGNLSFTKQSSTSDRIWFSGAFRYHLTLGDSVFERMDRLEQYMNVLLGARLDLSALWQAMPWSWLID